MLLAIDTATQIMSLALHDGRNLLAEESWRTNNNHTIELAPAIEIMLDRCEATMRDLTALAVATGPGSFSGLRIGVSMAKGMAGALKLPLVGISTLDILAAGQPQLTGGLVAVVQAGRGRVIAQTYRWRKGQWANRSEPQIMDWETLFNSIDGPAHLTGEVSDVGLEALAAAQSRDIPVTLLPAVYRLRRAGFLAEEAWEKLRTDDKANFEAAKVLPVYVKTKDSPL
jgi:tRNA threonylcarbamoyladenosine biosynthesis protein TsaB